MSIEYKILLLLFVFQVELLFRLTIFAKYIENLKGLRKGLLLGIYGYLILLIYIKLIEYAVADTEMQINNLDLKVLVFFVLQTLIFHFYPRIINKKYKQKD